MDRTLMKIAKLILCSYLFSMQLYASILQESVDKMINAVDPSINMSMSVVDLSTGEQLYQRHSDHALIPASNMKLFSEAAALLALGPDYRFQRQLSTDATMLDNGTLQGNVYLSLPGDPSFTSNNLNTLLSSLSSWGIRRITGNIVLDNSNASVDPYPPGRDPKDKSRGYGAPITPIIIDENRLTIIINPGHKGDDPAYIEVSAPEGVIAINNSVKTSSQKDLSALNYKLDELNQLTTTGAIGSGTWAFEQRLAIQNPLKYATDLIKAQLKEKNIVVDGQVIQGNTPEKVIILATQTSRPLKQLMADTLKPSDNVFADSLFIHAASIISGTPINWIQANEVAKKFLQQQTGINLTKATIIDGSGLSKEDRITADQTIHLLSYIYSHFPIAYEFISALPISGYDGTLERRFNKTSQLGLIRAKTGTMTGILSLSGYLSTANGHTLAFAMYINRRPKTPPEVSGKYHDLIDRLCNYFLMQKPDGKQIVTSQNTQMSAAFQQHPSQSRAQHFKQARWRSLELTLRKELQGHNIAIIYKPNELVLKDNAGEIKQVWDTLTKVSKKFSFSTTLKSATAPIRNPEAVHLLWIKTNAPSDALRTWILRKNTA